MMHSASHLIHKNLLSADCANNFCCCFGLSAVWLLLLALDCSLTGGNAEHSSNTLPEPEQHEKNCFVIETFSQQGAKR
jgi:hypothetical protein